MKNIHVLPTSQPSRLYFWENKLRIGDCINVKIKNSGISNQNIYITSDEEIKEGDWFLTKTNDVLKVQKPEKSYEPIGKKIILTDNKDLIKDGVQAIDDEFLEWFVKNPSCEEVEVKELLSNSGNAFYGYKIIIPKEEPKQELPQFGTKEFYTFFSDLCDKNLGGKPKQEIKFEDVFNDEKKQGLKEFIDNHKQETLEEAAENYVNSFEYGIAHPRRVCKNAFINGAKWQQEQIGKSEFLQKLRATMSDAEARRLIFETFKKK